MTAAENNLSIKLKNDVRRYVPFIAADNDP